MKKASTKKDKADIAASVAEKRFNKNREKIENPSMGIVEQVVRSVKEKGLRKDMDDAKEKAKNSPTGVKRKTEFSKAGDSYNSQVTPGEWKTYSVKNGVRKVEY